MEPRWTHKRDYTLGAGVHPCLKAAKARDHYGGIQGLVYHAYHQRQVTIRISKI